MIKIREYEEKDLENCKIISEIVGINFNNLLPIKFISEKNNKIVGFITSKIKNEKLICESIAVISELRKEGIGKLLFNKLIMIAKINKIRIIEVLADERAYSFWEEQKFQLIEKLPTTYRMQLDMEALMNAA